MTQPQVQLGGVLGTALQASRRGRLHHFISSAHSPAIAMFARAVTQANFEGDWYGEHAGKWLVAASRSAARDGDAALAAHVREVADFLVQQQEAEGYLGTYAPPRRFMVPQPPKPVPGTWDGAPSVRTWDIWTHSYLILGLLEAHRHWPEPRWLAAACRIGDLCWHTLKGGSAGENSQDGDGDGSGTDTPTRAIDINELGNHHGMSATVLMDPAVELFTATGQQRYLDLALLVLAQAEANPGLALVSRANAGVDAFEIATGKAYQLAWNLVGLAKLHRATGRQDLRDAATRLWTSIRTHHLTLGGGPWGGVAHRSREVFNPPGVFSPQAYVETCSTLAWIQLNRELLAITGEAAHAEEVERAAYNDLLGALAPNGEDWCYYSFPNGRRVHTTAWRCCKSSGAMALEELPAIACTQPEPDLLSVNLYGAGSARATLADGSVVTLEQRTAYPFDGAISLRVGVARGTAQGAADDAAHDAAHRAAHGAGNAAGNAARNAERNVPASVEAIDAENLPASGASRAADIAASRTPQGTPPSARFTLRLRCPSWATGATVRIGGEALDVQPGGWATVTRNWSQGDRVELMFPMEVVMHRRVNQNTQESKAPDGSDVRQQVLHDAWLALTRGPLVYATTLIDGFKSQESVCLPPPDHAPARWLKLLPPGADADDPAPTIRMALGYRAPLDFTPYYRTGGRVDGAWRLTWLHLAPDPATATAPASDPAPAPAPAPAPDPAPDAAPGGLPAVSASGRTDKIP